MSWEKGAHWSIEAIGSLLLCLTLFTLLFGFGPTTFGVLKSSLPIVLAFGVIAFGRWLHHGPFAFSNQQRLYVALGQFAGCLLFLVILGWLVVVWSVGRGWPELSRYIVLNSAAVGTLGSGILVAVYLHTQQQQAILHARTEQLQAQNTRLEKLAKIVSHDIRNPLAVAQAQLRVAREEDDPQAFMTVSHAHGRIETITSEMLTLAQQTHAPSETTEVDLDDVAHLAWQTVDTGDAELEVGKSVTVRAAKNRLLQALENLFRNSIEHGGDGLTTIRVGAVGSRGFYVEDDGVGIPEANRDEIFDWGVTGGRTSTGFGLAIVKEVADAHDWTVEVTDSPDNGVRFEITDVDADSVSFSYNPVTSPARTSTGRSDN